MRQQQWGRVLTGLLILMVGVLALLDSGLLSANNYPELWIVVLATAAVGYSFVYLRNHDYLAGLGAYITGALALLLLVITQNIMSGTLLPVLVLTLIGAPFLVFGLRRKENWGLLVPAYVMFVLALMLLLIQSGLLRGELVPAYVLAAIGLPFLVGAQLSHEPALLIPAGIMLALALLMLGMFSGFGLELLTVGVPLLLILAGTIILLRSGTHERKSQEI